MAQPSTGQTLHWALLALTLSACGASVLSSPADPLLRDQMSMMHDFEAWYGGFEKRMADPSPEAARDCASEALFVLRNPDLWSGPAMAPSIIAHERFLQLARWEALRAVEGSPKDMRALSALSEIDALADDREGAAWARCRAADIADVSFSAQASCATALAVARHENVAVEIWQRAFPLADRDGQRFYVLHELEQEGQGKILDSFPTDVVARYRALVESIAAPPSILAPAPPKKAIRPDDAGPVWPPKAPASRLGDGVDSDSN
jgi:hypothetical protein